jgi:hypothetical protein
MAAKKRKKSTSPKSLKNKLLAAVKPLTVYLPDANSRIR